MPTVPRLKTVLLRFSTLTWIILIAGCASPSEQLVAALARRDSAEVARIAGSESGRYASGQVLIARVRSGDIEAVRLLLDAGSDKAIERGYVTPLMHAAVLGKVEIARLLIDRGADVNARVDTVILRPLSRPPPKAPDIPTRLPLGKINLGTESFAGGIYHYKLEYVDGAGHSALSYAIDQKQKEMVKLLIQKGANKNLIVVCSDPQFALVDVLAFRGRSDALRTNFRMTASNNAGQDLFYQNVNGYVTTNSAVAPQEIMAMKDLARKMGDPEIIALLAD